MTCEEELAGARETIAKLHDINAAACKRIKQLEATCIGMVKAQIVEVRGEDRETNERCKQTALRSPAVDKCPTCEGSGQLWLQNCPQCKGNGDVPAVDTAGLVSEIALLKSILFEWVDSYDSAEFPPQDWIKRARAVCGDSAALTALTTPVAEAVTQPITEQGKDAWIPVSERMPPQRTPILIATGRYVTVSYVCRNGHFHDDLSDDIEGVTHWQPLPAAPSSVTGEGKT